MTPVVLDRMIARCPTTRTRPCARHDTCAHALCDPANRPVQDYSIEARTSDGACRYWLDASRYRKPSAASAPRIFEPVKGLT